MEEERGEEEDQDTLPRRSVTDLLEQLLPAVEGDSRTLRQHRDGASVHLTAGQDTLGLSDTYLEILADIENQVADTRNMSEADDDLVRHLTYPPVS